MVSVRTWCSEILVMKRWWIFRVGTGVSKGDRYSGTLDLFPSVRSTGLYQGVKGMNCRWNPRRPHLPYMNRTLLLYINPLVLHLRYLTYRNG